VSGAEPGLVPAASAPTQQGRLVAVMMKSLCRAVGASPGRRGGSPCPLISPATLTAVFLPPICHAAAQLQLSDKCLMRAKWNLEVHVPQMRG
jgi:hypothetical protein